jgi:glycine/D-amino acid oxidase-like deaminating enzyme
VRVCIIGGGLAGTLLAWRLRRVSPSSSVDLVLGSGRTDATAVSGGGVRAYETEALARSYATESLNELLASPMLREWSGFRRIGSTYLRPAWPDAEAEVAGLPDGARLADATELKGLGWAALAQDTLGVLEPYAGHISPDGFRHALLNQLAGESRVRIVTSEGTLVKTSGGSGASSSALCRIGAEAQSYDRIVIATGAWTPQVLATLGLAPEACGDVKAIQYALHPAAGSLPTFFVDDTSGLYGRPISGLVMLLGVPVTEYGGPADGGPHDGALVRLAAELAAQRLPHLRLGPATTVARSADCYRLPYTLTLRPVEGRRGIFTFTGGSGGSAKTALAASRHAAAQLIADSVAPRPPVDAHTECAAELPNTLYERVES